MQNNGGRSPRLSIPDAIFIQAFFLYLIPFIIFIKNLYKVLIKIMTNSEVIVVNIRENTKAIRMT